MHEQGHVMAQCRIMWDFMQITTSYSDSLCIHTDDIQHHCQSEEAWVISPTLCPWRCQFTKFIFVHDVSKSLWNTVVTNEWNSTFVVSHANGTDIPICCARCANGFLGTVYNIVLISYSFSSACIFCMISYCLKDNKLVKILILICKLLSLTEMVHPETVVSICDDTSCGNYI